ncbi:MAG: nucleotide-binding universal stress UspA family protein [Planctomycetaceae bacterium]|jgi:nucleotide-binding universal stress UspA family protein
MQYQHLLVPVDIQESASSAIEAALEMAAQHRARTTLLYVIEAIDLANEPDDEISHFYSELEDSIRLKLAEVARRFEAAGLSVDQEIVIGHQVRDIVHYSATQSIDLIVMNSQRVDPNQPGRGVGSISHQVSVFCQCPVMLIK